MNKQQLRHAKSMASKISVQLQIALNEMGAVTRLSESDAANVPIQNIVSRFTHDMGYGVVDNMEAVQQIIDDMLPELSTGLREQRVTVDDPNK